MTPAMLAMSHPLNLLAFADETTAATIVDGPSWAGWILWLPLISLMLCGVCAILRVKTKMPAWITVACLGLSFILTLALYMGHHATERVMLFRWLDVHWNSPKGSYAFIANFALYIDSLTLLWMLFVTGLGALIALYASEYMEHDVGKGYTRFFAGVSVFLFAMSCLVMSDNLLMLYLGWEGVGFASYWLIGYFYQKPSAVAAAKKAFIVNRIGDLGLALAIYLIYHAFGSVEYATLFELIRTGHHATEAGGWSVHAIPYLLMLGAFGKSAQLPLYVWLPDAMEGPTPVSALIHAATMVTAGVYLVARMYPVFLLEPASLHLVAWIGTLTALLAATIGMAQYDIKRIMAYSTVSQLGYMFAGLGVMTSVGGCFHVFTHAFFKAVLFLTCGAIMHGFAGQLDLRKISGLRHMTGWKIVAYTMLVGCLCLAGFPFTSGFYSKDMILAEAFSAHGPGFHWIGWILLFTAGLTAYYTFRVWFRVCAGPVHFEMGDEHHGDDVGHGQDHHGGIAHGSAWNGGGAGHGHDQPHPPRMAINFVLVVITIGAILAALAYFIGGEPNWITSMVADSSAAGGVPGHAPAGHADGGAHGTFLGMNPHTVMYYVSAVVGFLGIGIAFVLHKSNRKAADRLRARLLANRATRWLPTAMENKWYVDELYNAIIVLPMWVIGHMFALIDRYIIDWLLVDGIARLPKAMGRAFQPLQNGVLQSYAVSMAGGAALATVLIIVVMPLLRPWLITLFGGGG
jgi:NADH-quinone oxidoreductase subunit L